MGLRFTFYVFAIGLRRTSRSGRILTLPPIPNLPERGCVQSTSRSALKVYAAFDQFENVCLAKLLRLVFDPAALRRQVTAYALNEIQARYH